MWTHFYDMHSGGGSKEKWEHIYIEAPESEAEIVFYNRFGHNPHRVSCTCCGADYSLSEFETLEEAYQYYPVEGGESLVIREAEIKPEERHGELPQSGYVWMGD